MNNSVADPELIALDRFVSAIYWADTDMTFNDALIEAIDDWTATASAEHNESQPFSSGSHTDPLAASLHELLAATEHLTRTSRPGLTVMRALSEALADWEQDDT